MAQYQLGLFAQTAEIDPDIARALPADLLAIMAGYGLGSEAQHTAVRRYLNLARPTAKAFAAICAECGITQSGDYRQQGSMF
jgi:hypothetical protein